MVLSSKAGLCSSLHLNVTSTPPSPLGLPLGPAEFIANPHLEDGIAQINWDDFALEAKGSALIATELGNSVQRVTPRGVVDIIAGGINSTTLAEPSSVTFGRTKRDSNTLRSSSVEDACF
ncbi:uncharacterized protein TRUGW13939_08908 [Talaromyces rugulosus]|uniref:SMP-30/Gluconolactonase/LRE-like region domain-containing protein n=1 Tax=Talaromyces rugulosus TaxID=121627 RepID=A0A7H8R5U5_TALRU|nr:uncharacterized protein TRUGW13939_08908 [Talaromyces rugulosus]QKX61752.1 hypothetical protein TRUGW13939_08908 [Talaromyces rugulosus]